MAGATSATFITVEALSETLAVHLETFRFRTFADNVIIRTFLPEFYLLHFLHQLLLLLQRLLTFATSLSRLLELRICLFVFLDLLLLSLGSVDQTRWLSFTHCGRWKGRTTTVLLVDGTLGVYTTLEQLFILFDIFIDSLDINPMRFWRFLPFNSVVLSSC